MPRGGIAGVNALHRVGARWYADRLRADWRPRSIAEKKAIFAEAGLTTEFWSFE